MAKYRVSWHVTIVDAESVMDAATQANELRRHDPENEYSYLRVADPDGHYWRVETRNGDAHAIDRDEAERMG